jgi:hypothetical protein
MLDMNTIAILVFVLVASAAVYGYWYGMKESVNAYRFPKGPPNDPPEAKPPSAH